MLTDGTNRSRRDDGNQREPDHPWFPLSGYIRYGAQDWYREHYHDRRQTIPESDVGIGSMKIRHQPHRERQCGDIHREDRIGKIVKRPAPAFSRWGHPGYERAAWSFVADVVRFDAGHGLQITDAGPLLLGANPPPASADRALPAH